MSVTRHNHLLFLEHCLGIADGSGTSDVPGTRPDLAEHTGPEEELLARLAHLAPLKEPPDDMFSAIEAQIDALSHAPVQTTRADEGEWIKRADKVWKKILFSDPQDGNTIYLLRCEPGAVIPSHEHERDEKLFVIEGEFSDGNSVVKAGDFQLSRAGSVHPAVTSATGCLVLVHC